MKEKRKENGNGWIAKTERGMKRTPKSGEEKGSAELGKFKDVNALLQAYLALEAEFTRRSQRLKALEEEREKQRVDESAVSGETDLAEEVLHGDTPEEDGAKEGATQAQSVASASPQTEKTPTQQEFCDTKEQDGEASVEEEERSLPKPEDVRETKTDDEALYSAVLANEAVRLRIIGEYLTSVAKSAAPIIKGGSGTLAVTAKRAENISTAGAMALKMFQKAKQKA